MARRSEAEIMQNWPAGGAPLVTVIAICYNHEPYLRAALDSILAQETDFPFEVLIHDDASPDGSADIIREYAAEYPHILRPILEAENRFSKGAGQIVFALCLEVRGRYLAYLDCDDYWTDPHKLQEQVDFLEAHPAYVATAHNCTVVDENGVPTGEPYPECRDEEYTAEHYLRNILPGQFGTLVMRNIFTNGIKDFPLLLSAPPGPLDRAIYLTLLDCGRIHCIQKSMSAYRHITSGGTSYSATYRFDLKRETLFYRALMLHCKKMGRIGEAIGMQRWLVWFLDGFVKAGKASEAELAPVRGLCRASMAALTDRLTGTRRRCACCGQAVQYAPMPIDQEEALSATLPFTAGPCNPDAWRCPVCGCDNAERLSAEALTHLERGDGARFRQLLLLDASEALAARAGSLLPGAALTRCGADTRALPEAGFDLIVCPHLPEALTDAELSRLVKDDGCVLLTAPAGGDFAVRTLGVDFFGEALYREAGLPESAALYALTRPGHAAPFAAGRRPETDTARLKAYVMGPEDSEYREEKSVGCVLPLRAAYGGTLPLEGLGELTRLRVDPTDCPCFLRAPTASLLREDGAALPLPLPASNGLAFAGGLVFGHDDPQLEFAIPRGRYRALSFSCELLSDNAELAAGLAAFSEALDRERAERGALNEALTAVSAERDAALAAGEALRGELRSTQAERDAALAAGEALRGENDALRRAYTEIAESSFWKLTKPARATLDAMKGLFREGDA